MKTRLKLIAAAVGLALASALLVPATGLTTELRTLRGPTAVEDNTSAPAVPQYLEGGTHDRSFRQQPPLIPHRIEKYQVDLKVNQCVSCHDWTSAKKMKAPQISETHYLDRNGQRLDYIAGTRWFCTQCHVPQTDAKPLVENNFVPANAAR